jgi:hypothetical protein
MSRYRSIPMEIEAIQATKDNIDEVKALAGDAFVEDGGYGYPHLKVGGTWHKSIHWGDWVVKTSTGFDLFMTRDIQNFFEEVEESTKLATGGFIEGPPTPIEIDLSRERIITAEQARNSPTLQAALEKFRQSVVEIQERESRDGDSPNS